MIEVRRLLVDAYVAGRESVIPWEARAEVRAEGLVEADAYATRILLEVDDNLRREPPLAEIVDDCLRRDR